MKTEEFKQQVQNLGYKTIDGSSDGKRVTQVHILDNEVLIAKVSTMIQYRLSTMNNKIGKRHSELFDLLVTYAKTPIKDRR
ncbi:hypothetical protein WMB10_01845 [Tetragenococcus halophilus]|uniref:hypothetical protein n=1 Tax=Tetragenococcus halophilus TaxID=51669 RepID=UPI0030C97870